MDQSTTYKGRLMATAAAFAIAGPWRGVAERTTCNIGHRFPNSKIVVAFCRHLGTQLIQREGQQFARIVTFDSGGRMLCAGEARIALNCAMYYFLGTITNQDEDERPMVRLLSRLVRKGDNFFDIGANVGFYSFFVAPLCGPSGSVHAFEANPLLIEHLRRSAELSKAQTNIVINAGAIGREENKTVELYDPEKIGGSSLYQLEWLEKSRTVSVPLSTIDAYVRANGIDRIDVVKIDIEGAELDAFVGMEETFTRCPPAVILCELALLLGRGNRPGEDLKPGERAGYATEVVEFLRAKGYEPRFIDEADGRIGAVIQPGSLPGLSQNLINVAFVRPGLTGTRPELFAA